MLSVAAPGWDGSRLGPEENRPNRPLDYGGSLAILHAVIPLRRYVDGGPSLPRRTEAEDEPVRCDACGDEIDGAPAGSGLFLWTRGDEVRYEEPPLCERCAYTIAVGGMLQWDLEEED